MAVNRLVKFALVTAGVLVGLFVLAVVGTMMFVFSIGTATVTLKVIATVFDRAQGKPVAGCLLAFEKDLTGGPGTAREERSASRRFHETAGRARQVSNLRPSA